MELEHLEFIVQVTDTKTGVAYSADERRLYYVTVFTYMEESCRRVSGYDLCGFGIQK